MHRVSPALLVLLTVFSLCQGWWYSQPDVGESCTELVGNRAERCDEPMAVMETVEPVDEMEGFGPNVCVTERMETVSAAEYVIERTCYGFFCRVYCAKTEDCSVRNFTSTVYDCCPGFAAQSGSNHGFGYGHYNRHPGYNTLVREGCTIELRESVAVCLEELGLTEFSAALEGSSLVDSQDEVTVFAPTNEAIDGQFLSQSVLSTHIVGEMVRNSDLRDGAVLHPLYETTLLHVTDVHKYHLYSLKFSEETFINGAQINTSDACLAENGVVHTLNSIIPSSPLSIAELLAASPQFSDFVSLLNAANITQFLDAGRNTSRTVFAPTNDAFDKLPEGAVECLLRPENIGYAKKLVLIHITAPAEYTSSLSQRNYIKTFCYYYLLVCVINDTIHLTRDSVPLIDTDIAARNGVIHTLDTVLLSDYIDYEELCPPTPSPSPSPGPSPFPSPAPSPSPSLPLPPIPVDTVVPEIPEIQP